jgi:dihydroxy-acid dehydratase
VRDGDRIALDVAAGRIELLVDAQTLAERRKGWVPPLRPERGYYGLYFDEVLQAEYGCDFDFLRKVPVRTRRK